jgi:formate dehydrogenase accessory protein FdhE
MNSWDSCINRCRQLAEASSSTKELLSFYTSLLETQKHIYDSLQHLIGSLLQDLPELKKHLPALLEVVRSTGPAALVTQARDPIDDLLIDYWHNRSDQVFFAKALLQPYARRVVESNSLSVHALRENQCPFCLGKPQVSFLKGTDSGAESSNRNLLCATCLSSWEFRRVVCAACGEEQPTQLGYFQSDEYPHVRIETCDSCKRYIKGVDLTRLGLAEPLVDDVATAALDLWAVEKGYTKIELNLIGL